MSAHAMDNRMEAYHTAPLGMEAYGTGAADPYGTSMGWQDEMMLYGADPADAAGATVLDAMMSSDPDNFKTYQQYREKGVGGIDPETGIAPRRLTDCVCIVVFACYCIGMLALVLVVKSKSIDGRQYSDVRRLTHGMDYQARLCGVDKDVADKQFLFWCRSNPQQWYDQPGSLDLWNPTCVAECPDSNSAQVEVACLYPEQNLTCGSESGNGWECTIPAGQFGNVENYHFLSQESIVYSTPYETLPRGGRYCLPKNETLRQSVLQGPLHFGVRAFASFEHCWGILFFAALAAVAMSYLYVLFMNECARLLVYGFLGVAYAIFASAGLWFASAVILLLPGAQDRLNLDGYKRLNHFYKMDDEFTASVISFVLGLVLLFISSAICGTITHVAHTWGQVRELIQASAECFTSMKSMLVPPAIEALWKFLMAWLLTSNFLILVSSGKFNELRIEINGQLFKGLSTEYHFDWALLPWLFGYLFGSVWIMELCTAFGQFLVAFSVISWYFMKKEGDQKTGVPPLPPLHGTADALVYHMGSLCLGAAIIPWIRPLRILNWMLHESVPSEKAECCGPFEFLTGCFRRLGRICGSLTEHHCMPKWLGPRGLAYKYTKNAYIDVIIRSQHFLPAAQRTFWIINTHKSCQKYMMSCMIITIVGVVSVGITCAGLTYMAILLTPSLSDPESATFVVAPTAVCGFAFCLCASIAYGFMMLFDHTADTLLYCYAWNKRFNKETVEQFMPESLRDLVGHILEKEDGYQYFGNARPEMYLSTWMPKKYADDKTRTANREGRQQPGHGQQSQQQHLNQQTDASYHGQGPMFGGGAYDTAGHYTMGTGYAPDQHSEPFHGDALYTGAAYEPSGRYTDAG